MGEALPIPVRVVLANQPRLLRELLLQTIRSQSGIEVIAEVHDELDVERIVDENKPDFLIVSLNEKDKCPAICNVLLLRYPGMKILGLATERNKSMFFWSFVNSIESVPVEASEDGILAVLRGPRNSVGG